MTKYIEVINNDNVISLDDKTERLHRTRSATLSNIGVSYDVSLFVYPTPDYTNDPHLIRRIRSRAISLRSNEEFIAIRANESYDKIGFSLGFDGNDTVYLYEYLTVGYDVSKESNYVVDYYGTGITEIITAGLQVFDENGSNVPIFSSGEYYVDVKSAYNSVIDDGGQVRPIYNTTYWPESISLGGVASQSTAIVTNSCKHSMASDGYYGLFDALYVVVFGTLVHLELRYTTGDANYSNFAYSRFNAGVKYYPPFSFVNSGVLIKA